MPDNNDSEYTQNMQNKEIFYQELKKHRMNLLLPSPRMIIRIRRKIVRENYEKYGPTNTRYEIEKKKENSIFLFDEQNPTRES